MYIYSFKCGALQLPRGYAQVHNKTWRIGGFVSQQQACCTVLTSCMQVMLADWSSLQHSPHTQFFCNHQIYVSAVAMTTEGWQMVTLAHMCANSCISPCHMLQERMLRSLALQLLGRMLV